VKVLQPAPLYRLIQVASLASRHEQITVRAAFFFVFLADVQTADTYHPVWPAF
jgi:hypothetical protein